MASTWWHKIRPDGLQNRNGIYSAAAEGHSATVEAGTKPNGLKKLAERSTAAKTTNCEKSHAESDKLPRLTGFGTAGELYPDATGPSVMREKNSNTSWRRRRRRRGRGRRG